MGGVRKKNGEKEERQGQEEVVIESIVGAGGTGQPVSFAFEGVQLSCLDAEKVLPKAVRVGGG